MSYTANTDRYYTSRMSSSCSIKSEESESDFDIDDSASATNSSSAYSLMNSFTSSSSYTLNDKRRSRNENEKKRRDQFNMLIQELGTLLNHPRKIDKATVLNETLFFFRNFNDKPLYNKEIDFKYKPFFLQNDEFMRFMIEFQNSFCLVFDLNGQIKYVSDHILHLLGHFPKNVQNCMLFEFIDEKSGKVVKNFLKRKFSNLDSISFDCKFKKGILENNCYEPLRVRGFFKKTDNSNELAGHFNTIARLDSFLKINQLFPKDNNKREFMSEFSMDFKYISLDQKAIEIIGFTPIELLGTLFYDYCHHDDLEKLIDFHKKLLQNGAAPTVSYRYRTKGLQWLWIESRFEITNTLHSSKNPTIVAHNKVVTLNEMLETRDILDCSTMKTFSISTPSRQIQTLKHSKGGDKDASNRDDLNQPSTSNSSRAATWDHQTSNNQTSSSSSSMIEFKEEKQHMPSGVSLIAAAKMESKIADSSGSSSSSYECKSTKMSKSSFADLATSIKKADQYIDDSLESIFLRSYNDIKYRKYVLNQFKMKKTKIENIIRKHQDELKILQETMENIGDEKKLASWVMEFQRQEYNTQLQVENESDVKPTKQNHHQQEQDPVASVINNDDLKEQAHSVRKYMSSQSESSRQQQQQQQSSPVDSYQQNNPQLTFSILDDEQTMQQCKSSKQPQRDTNINNAYVMSQQPKSNYAEPLIGGKQQSLMRERGDSDENLPKRVKLNGGKISPSRGLMKNDSHSNSINDLVSDLMSLQNLLPTSSSNSAFNTRGANGNVNDSIPNSKNIKNSASTGQLGLSNYADIDDINSEIIDKLFNSYSFDSFPSQ